MNAEDESSPRLPARLFWSGLACLLLAVAASAILAGKHLGVMVAPGCGEGSGCEEAAASAWGTVPLLGWPVSYLGLAYFAALAGAWIVIARRGPVPRLFRSVVRIGAAFSAMFLVVMIAGGYACPYCIAAHVGNFGFLGVLEIAPVAAGAARRVLAWTAAAFVVVTGIQFGLDATVAGVVREQAEQDIAASTNEVIAAHNEAPAPHPGDEDRPVFTGRHHKGPTVAPIRLVIFSDYQCPDCKLIEQQVRRVLEKYDNVSYSQKQNPICTDCNRHTNTNMHPNACWAARAAEAAGILRGNDGFWQMHEWLFDHGGGFTNDELNAALRRMGYDPDEFTQVMRSKETLDLVQADIEEGASVGIMRTPMIFINGVEMKGWMAPDALIKAIDRLEAANLTPRDASQDRPPSAFEKVVADWYEGVSQYLPEDPTPWTLGPADAPVRVVMWADLQEPYSRRADEILRQITASRGDVLYSFRHFPIDETCNPESPRTLHPKACLAAQAAEAAGRIAGPDGYWATHVWLYDHIDTLDEQTLREAAAEMHIDAGRLFTEMESPEVAEAIAQDAQAAVKLHLRSVPFIFINGKLVPRWNVDGALAAMIEKAARDQSSTSP